jgi:hypothetical protein
MLVTDTCASRALACDLLLRFSTRHSQERNQLFDTLSKTQRAIRLEMAVATADNLMSLLYLSVTALDSSHKR